ncbi:hypothetical protein BLOT_005137 [Blomia tropicalis]|nr:hypothetical protein BLOT_005137 [Blomia tropicalis]
MEFIRFSRLMILFIMAIVINGVKPSLFEVISKTYRNNSTIHNESNTTKNDVIRVVYDEKIIFYPQFAGVVIVLIFCISAVGVIFIMGPEFEDEYKQPKELSTVKPWTRDQHIKEKAANVAGKVNINKPAVVQLQIENDVENMKTEKNGISTKNTNETKVSIKNKKTSSRKMKPTLENID